MSSTKAPPAIENEKDWSLFYIDGRWVQPIDCVVRRNVINPATEETVCHVSMGSVADVDAAVKAAKRAEGEWRSSSVEQRIALLERFVACYERKQKLLSWAIRNEMGAPVFLADGVQSGLPISHTKQYVEILKTFKWKHRLRADTTSDYILHEPIGVVGCITPSNWPLHHIAVKVIGALAAGCCVVLKPSEAAPISAIAFADCIHEAGFPSGVFNLVNGDGPVVGAAMATHPQIDLISYTGTAGAIVARLAADSLKRLTLEVGGKGPNLIFPDCDVKDAVSKGTFRAFLNSGQTRAAPTRMLVQSTIYDKAVKIAIDTAERTLVGDPLKDGIHLGPVANKKCFDKIQKMIEVGISEGARLVAGGLGKPKGLARGYYCKPTVFADVDNKMRIAQEEIMGPVLCIISFETEEDAIRIANDSPYGLMAYLQCRDPERVQRVARRLKVGVVELNASMRATGSPFGGTKGSGYGREGGIKGFEQFLEIKSISGWQE